MARRVIAPWLCILFLFALNFFLCHELWRTEYTDRVISGDAAFISISRYMLEGGGGGWWPVWYNGIPAQNAYPPLLHALVAVLAATEGVSPALAHHQFATVVYALAPVGMFLLVLRMARCLRTAMFAGLAFSLVSPSTLLIPWARADVHGWLGPWRLCVLAAYGDAPHMFAFALIPFAILALDSALKGRAWLGAAMLFAAVMLTNWLGTVALVCSVIAYLLATTSARTDISRWGRTAVIGLSGYILACPWIPPSTVWLVRTNGQLGEGDFRAEMQHFPERALLVAAVLLLAKIGLHRMRAAPAIQLAIFLAVLPGGIPLLWEWAHVALFPMPHRYQWEMDFGLVLMGSLAAARAAEWMPRPMVLIALGVLAVAGCWQVREYRNYAAALIRPIDMTATVEYRAADWMRHHFPNDRMFAIGSVSYWLNAFSNLQQVAGGFEHATPHEQNRHAIQSITDEGPAETLLWLRAMGADLAVVGGPGTRAPFRRIQNPEKFDIIGEKVWSEGDDAIYRIPRRSHSLAHVVERSDLGDVARYVTALENPSLPVASFNWRNAHQASIRAELKPAQMLSVQVNFHPGWQAKVAGRSIRIERDSLGFMAMNPECNGPCPVELEYVGGWEYWLTRFAAASLLVVLAARAI